MNNRRFINALCLIALIICFMPQELMAEESQQVIQQKLNTIAQNIVQNAASSITPSKANKAVRKENNYFVASYVEVDAHSLRTELRPSERAGHYVGLIKYVEYFYECQGASKQAALNASCVTVKSRRLTEIISYDGKWHH